MSFYLYVALLEGSVEQGLNYEQKQYSNRLSNSQQKCVT